MESSFSQIPHKETISVSVTSKTEGKIVMSLMTNFPSKLDLLGDLALGRLRLEAF